MPKLEASSLDTLIAMHSSPFATNRKNDLQSGLVNIASHLTSVESSELIMTLVKPYVSEEKVVKSITKEIALDL